MEIAVDRLASVALRSRYFQYGNHNCFRYVACGVKYAYFVIIYFANKTPKDIFCQIRYEFCRIALTAGCACHMRLRPALQV